MRQMRVTPYLLPGTSDWWVHLRYLEDDSTAAVLEYSVHVQRKTPGGLIEWVRFDHAPSAPQGEQVPHVHLRLESAQLSCPTALARAEELINTLVPELRRRIQ